MYNNCGTQCGHHFNQLLRSNLHLSKVRMLTPGVILASLRVSIEVSKRDEDEGNEREEMGGRSEEDQQTGR